MTDFRFLLGGVIVFRSEFTNPSTKAEQNLPGPPLVRLLGQGPADRCAFLLGQHGQVRLPAEVTGDDLRCCRRMATSAALDGTPPPDNTGRSAGWCEPSKHSGSLRRRPLRLPGVTRNAVGQNARQPKVGNLQGVALQQEILWFDVAVLNIVAVKVVDAVSRLPEISEVVPRAEYRIDPGLGLPASGPAAFGRPTPSR